MKKALSLLFVFMLLLTAARAESLVISHIDETDWFNPGRFNTESGYLSLVGMDGLDDPDRLGRALLRIPGLKKVDLSGCPMTDAQLADLRSRMADHGIEVVWTLYLPRSSLNPRITRSLKWRMLSPPGGAFVSFSALIQSRYSS